MFAASMTYFERSPTFLELGIPFTWILQYWLAIIASLAGLGLAVGLVVSFLRRRNLVSAVVSTLQSFFEGLKDLATLPLGLRRIYAIAMLSFKEAIRRKVLYVFVMFLVPFLFVGWYLPNREEGQLLYLVAFVNSAITWLLLPLVVFVVAMNFPNDLKLRTIQTVVTKPVRRLEIVVGRVVGFMGIFTLVLAVMGGVSLFYLWRQISPAVYEEQWTARVPVYASAPSPDEAAAIDGQSYPLMFFKNGSLMPSGTNVGKEFAYRSHVEGETTDEARYYFHFDPAEFDGSEAARLQLTLDIFKTTKGDPTRDVGDNTEGSGVFCNLKVIDRETGAEFTRVFRVDHHRTTEIPVPTEILTSGKALVAVQCVTRSQFLGMAGPDVYFLANERSFAANFFKGMVSIWLKVLLLTTICVAASTVLNGFVTILLSTMVYILGVNYTFLQGIITGEVQGGGPIESAIRLFTQNNQTTELDPTRFNNLAVRIDEGILWLMDKISNVIPNLSTLNTAEHVAKGFDIPAHILGYNILIVFAYVVPVIVAGYFMLKSREIAA